MTTETHVLNLFLLKIILHVFLSLSAYLFHLPWSLSVSVIAAGTKPFILP